MKVGDKLEWFLQLEKEGRTIPLLDQMPELTQWEQVIWSAFIRLSNRRQSGMGISPISYQDIILFMDENRILDPDIREDYEHFITFLDDVFLKRKSEEYEKKRSQPKPPAAGHQPALSSPRR